MSAPFENDAAMMEAFEPALATFTERAEKLGRDLAEGVYDSFLGTVQDYLRQNVEWNIGAEIERCKQIGRDNIALRLANKDLTRIADILLGHDDRFQVAIGGNPIAVDEMRNWSRQAYERATSIDLDRGGRA